MSRPLCEGSQEPAIKAKPGDYAGECVKCGGRFRLNRDGKVFNHKAPVVPPKHEL
jgi:hypothetical protein